jgi:hypothetical protein
MAKGSLTTFLQLNNISPKEIAKRVSGVSRRISYLATIIKNQTDDGSTEMELANFRVTISADKKHLFLTFKDILALTSSPVIQNGVNKDNLNIPRTFPLFVGNALWKNSLLYYNQESQKLLSEAMNDLIENHGGEIPENSEHSEHPNQPSLYPRRIMRAAKIIAEKPRKDASLPLLLQRFGKWLWSEFDPDIQHKVLSICAKNSNSLHYNLIAHNYEEVERLLARTPGVVGAWLNIMERKVANLEVEENANPHMMWATEIKGINQLNHMVDEPLLGFYQDNQIVGEVQAWLSNHDMNNKKYWLYLCHLKANWVYLLMREGSRKSAKILRLMADTSEEPPWTMMRFVCRHWPMFINKEEAPQQEALSILDEPLGALDYWGSGTVSKNDIQSGEFYDKSIVPVMRLAFRECKTRRRYKDFANHELPLIMDWLNSDRPILDSNQRKASWGWFNRQQEAYHQRLSEEREARRLEQEAIWQAEAPERAARQEAFRARQAVEKAKEERRLAAMPQEWESPLEAFETKGYNVVPLTSRADLIDEAEQMDHCIDTWFENCVTRKSAVFSIRNDKKRFATFELRTVNGNPNDPGSWEFGQIHGYSNDRLCKLEEKFSKIAQNTAPKYRRALKKIIETAKEELELSMAG